MYEIHLDRDACDGVFACLVRDDRFVEAEDGLATLTDDTADGELTIQTDSPADDRLVARFDDEKLDDAKAAAAACPFDAIEVRENP